MPTLSDQLLDAHVHHVLARLHAEELHSAIEERVSALFAWLEEVRLEDLCSREQIQGVIRRYAIDFRPAGGLTELWGEFVRLVLRSPSSAKLRVDQILPDDLYEEFAEHVSTLPWVRRELSQLVARSSALDAMGAQLLTHELLGSLLPVERGFAHVRIPALRERLETKWIPGLEQFAASFLARVRTEWHAAQPTGRVRSMLDAHSLRAALDEIWSIVSPRQLGEVFAAIGEYDLDEFVVLGYEFWLRFRKSDYFRTISSELVDHFFARYGQESLALLLDDLGITPQMVVHELATFLPPLLEHARLTHQLESQVRAMLAPFYRSSEVQQLLQAVPKVDA